MMPLSIGSVGVMGNVIDFTVVDKEVISTYLDRCIHIGSTWKYLTKYDRYLSRD